MPGEQLRSSLCTERSLTDPVMLAWADRIRSAWDHTGSGAPVLAHRKIWEWVFLIQALHERGVLAPGRRGIGFGVGRDPLAALFASLGCEILATDIGLDEARRAGWVETDQHAHGLGALRFDEICDPDEFARLVTYRTVDMRALPADLRHGEFDFSWSACAFEHLGSLAAGEAFLLRQMDCLRPSGVAVHTTEFNVDSNRSTVAAGHTVLYRRRDIEATARRLGDLGHRIELDFDPGASPVDRHVDAPPWTGPHLKLRLGRFVATSIGIIVEKSPRPDGPSWTPTLAWRLRSRTSRDVWTATDALRGGLGRLGRPVLPGGRGIGHASPVPMRARTRGDQALG